jgi:hypothetical protein
MGIVCRPSRQGASTGYGSSLSPLVRLRPSPRPPSQAPRVDRLPPRLTQLLETTPDSIPIARRPCTRVSPIDFLLTVAAMSASSPVRVFAAGPLTKKCSAFR